MTTQAATPADVALARDVVASLIETLEEARGWAEAVESLEAARAHLYAVDDAADAGAALTALEKALTALGDARRHVSGRASDEARRAEGVLPRVEQLVLAAHDVLAEREVARDRTRGVGPSRVRYPFRASCGGVPSLFHLDRRVIPATFASAALPPVDPGIDELEPPEEEDDDEEDEASSPPGAPRRRRLPLATRGELSAAQVELSHLARYALEEIGIASALRRPTAKHAWSIAELAEQRLLRHLDALMSLGVGPLRIDVVRACIDYERQLFALDPGRIFARTLVVGCLAGRDAADVAVASIAAAHKTTRRSVVDGLSLASSPAIGAAVRAELLRAPEPALVASLLEILRRRGDADVATVGPLAAHPAPEVRAEVARALGCVTSGSNLAIRLLEDLLRRHDDTPTRLAAAQALAIQGSKEGIGAARGALDAGAAGGDAAQWAHLCAIAGEPSDVDRILRAGERSPVALPALGWLGHPAGVPALIDALARERLVPRESPGERRPVEVALASALERLTGAGLVDELLGEDRVGDLHEAPTTDPDRWRAHWAQVPAPDPRLRLRRGEPWVPLHAIEELEAPLSFADARQACAIELAITAGPAAIVDTGAWFARQELALVSARQRLGARLTEAPGSPPSRRLRAK